MHHFSAGTEYFYPNGFFFVDEDKPVSSGWVHVLFNFIGTNDGQGIEVYYDGENVGMDTSRRPHGKSNGHRSIIVGASYSADSADYASVKLDELLFFNVALTETQIALLSNESSSN